MKQFILATIIFTCALTPLITVGAEPAGGKADPKTGIVFPADDKVDTFCDKVRHQFKFHGYNAWIVVPHHPLPGKQWFAVPEWPTAFTGRNGVKALLDMGYYMVHVNLFGEFANDKAVDVMHKMYGFLQQNGFQKKGAFIGMSLGGLYTFRYAQAHPEGVACIYADAPVCDLNYKSTKRKMINAAYKTSSKEKFAVFSPVNHLDQIAKAKIPVLMLIGTADDVVDPKTNGLLWAERFKKAGGQINVVKRIYGHHPHGLDNPGRITGFLTYHTLKQNN
jgi:dienelactone hydrolase